MKRYEFLFITKIKFEHNIINHHFMIRCLPGSYQFQRIYDENLSVLPAVTCTFGKDSFGNRTFSGSINDEHELFEYKVHGKALLSRYKSAEILDRVYLYETPSTRMSQDMKDFAAAIYRKGDIHEQAFDISHAVYTKLKYVPDSTDTKTTAAEAFQQGHGVCQDYVHITVALLRNAGIPARYCAGLMVGEGETHAWVEYFDGSAWYGIDPTNDRIIEYGYIKISNGRDCFDCGIDRGCFASKKEDVNQNIEILVKVGELND